MPINGDPTDYIYSEYKNKLEKKFALYRGEIFNCALQIKVSLSLHDIKSENDIINFENFFSWLQQHCLLRQIVIDGYKITNDSHSYLSSILEPTLNREVISKLKNYSNFSVAIKELKIVIYPLQKYRNKRYAHLENEEVDGVILNLLSLLSALEKLYLAVDYIMHYLSNPFLIFLEQWNVSRHTSTTAFEYLFEHHYALVEFKQLTSYLSQLTNINNTSELTLIN